MEWQLLEIKGNYALQFDADSQFILQIKAPHRPLTKIAMLLLCIISVCLCAFFIRMIAEYGYAVISLVFFAYMAWHYLRAFLWLHNGRELFSIDKAMKRVIFFRMRNDSSFHNQNFHYSTLQLFGFTKERPSGRTIGFMPFGFGKMLGYQSGPLSFCDEFHCVEFGASLTQEEAEMIGNLIRDFRDPHWKRPEEWIIDWEE
ncbi:MAG: hypothetical protein AAFN10_02900 [Bacteroidota bacterium]